MPHLICYDISDDGLRQKAADRLLEFGCYRLQKSVFAGDLNEASFKELLGRLKKIQEEALQATDSILILPCTMQQLHSAIHLGAVPPDWSMLTQPPNTLIL